MPSRYGVLTSLRPSAPNLVLPTPPGPHKVSNGLAEEPADIAQIAVVAHEGADGRRSTLRPLPAGPLPPPARCWRISRSSRCNAVRAASPAPQPGGDATIGRRRAPACGGPGYRACISIALAPSRSGCSAIDASMSAAASAARFATNRKAARSHVLAPRTSSSRRPSGWANGRSANSSSTLPRHSANASSKRGSAARNGCHALARAADRTAWRRVPLARRAAGSRPPGHQRRGRRQHLSRPRDLRTQRAGGVAGTSSGHNSSARRSADTTRFASTSRTASRRR